MDIDTLFSPACAFAHSGRQCDRRTLLDLPRTHAHVRWGDHHWRVHVRGTSLDHVISAVFNLYAIV